MGSKVLTAAVVFCTLAASAQAQDILTSEDVQAAVEADSVAQAPSQQIIDAVKDAPPGIVSGSVTVTPTIDVPAAVSASMPEPVSGTLEVSGTMDMDTTAGVTTLDEAFAAISATHAVPTEPETTTLEGSGEKLEDYMKDAARPVEEGAADAAVVPMPPDDGDDMMGY